MHRHAVFASLHRGTHLAAAIVCNHPQRLAWVGVYPLDLSQPNTRTFLKNKGLSGFPSSGRAYHIRAFEVEKGLIEADASIGETELNDAQSFVAPDDAALVRQLQDLGVPLESLELPYKSNYPI